MKLSLITFALLLVNSFNSVAGESTNLPADTISSQPKKEYERSCKAANPVKDQKTVSGPGYSRYEYILKETNTRHTY